MTSRYAQLAFTDAVRSHQEEHNSRRSYARLEEGPQTPDVLGSAEAGFIEDRDSFYLASTGADGWPYIQHRGGPQGFLHVLDEHTIAFADFRGNKQYITVGNLDGDDRVSLMLMDYPHRARLKILGHAHTSDDPELLERLTDSDYPGRPERAIVIRIEAYDWNCQQHLTPRFSAEELQPLRLRIEELEARLGRTAT
jgi:predicted pyridoxine 5'-phosphate oxidase superfamily flavin-nucleotide-binding protein